MGGKGEENDFFSINKIYHNKKWIKMEKGKKKRGVLYAPLNFFWNLYSGAEEEREGEKHQKNRNKR